MIFLRRFIIFCLLIVCVNLFAQDDDVPGNQKILILKLQDVEFNFKDKQTFETSVLEGIINTTKSDDFLRSEFYTDSKRIQKFLFDNGFLDAQVDTSSKIGDDSNRVIATFNITEKARYRINRVIYNGINEIAPDIYQLIMRDPAIVKGKHYNKTEVQVEITRTLTLLVNNGYALAQADIPDVVKFISKDTSLTDKVDILLNFTPKDRYSFGKTTINLSNNVYDISPDDLRRELEYNPGEIYSKEKLIISENRISKIAIFENGRIQIDNIDSLRNVINLKINATITNKYELKPEILGYDLGGRFYGGAGLSFSNKYFFGGGRVFTSSLKALIHDFDFYRFEGLATIYQPHLFDNDKITGNNSFGVTTRHEDIYNITSVKNLASIKYELRNFTYFNNLVIDWKLSNDRIKIFGVLRDTVNGAIYEIIDPVINVFTSAIGVTVVHNQVDNIQFPTGGTYASYSLEETGLLGSLVKNLFNTSTTSYLKLTTQNKAFFDISSDNKGTSVFGAKFSVGNIFQYGNNTFKFDTINIEDQLVPNDANYIIGGSASLRGWKAGTLGADVDATIGGGFIIDGSFEHRTKPFASSKNTLIKDLGFATFLDYGNVWSSYKAFRFDQIAMAIGAGIRYYTIVGAFRFDLGFKLYDPGVDNNKWLFQNELSKIFGSGYRMEIQFGIGNTF